MIMTSNVWGGGSSSSGRRIIIGLWALKTAGKREKEQNIIYNSL